MSTPETQSDRADPATRKTRLVRAVQKEVAAGGHVEVASDYDAVIRYERPANHVLHLILTLLTCGLWVFPWLGAAYDARKARKTIMLTVDEYGRTIRRES